MPQKLLLQDEVKTGVTQTTPTVQHPSPPAKLVKATKDAAGTNAEQKQLKQAQYQKAQFLVQVCQTVLALVMVTVYALIMQSVPNTVGAMGGVAFVSMLIYRILVWQHYFRTGKIISDGKVGSPLRFYVFPGLMLAIMAAMQVPLLQDSGGDTEMLWNAAVTMGICLAGALFFVAVAIITLKRQSGAR